MATVNCERCDNTVAPEFGLQKCPRCEETVCVEFCFTRFDDAVCADCEDKRK